LKKGIKSLRRKKLEKGKINSDECFLFQGVFKLNNISVFQANEMVMMDMQRNFTHVQPLFFVAAVCPRN